MISVPLLFSICFSAICTVSLFLGIYTFYTDPMAKTNRLFFSLTISLAIWSFGFAMAISAPDISTCLLWRRFAAIGWGVFFTLLLRFLISLCGFTSMLNRWWKYVLLYLPAAVCILVFTYFPWFNPEQYKLVHTPMGWVNVSIKNFWDWFFILYYVTYTIVGIYLIWRWGKNESSKNIKKQSDIIMRAFIVTLILGVFSESIVNNVFSIRIPQIAPIIMLIPVAAVSYAMQKYGFLYIRRSSADSLLFGAQIRSRVIHYMASSLIAGSVLNVTTMYFISENRNLWSIFLLSGLLTISGVALVIVERLVRSTRLKDFIFAAVFFIMIPAITLSFINYASITVWAVGFIFLIISVAMVSRIIQIAAATSIILTQLAVFFLKPNSPVTVNVADHIGRIGLSIIAIWISLFVMNVFRVKLLENAYQISFQETVADITTRYISVGEKGFDEVANETLCRISEFLKAEGAFIYLFNNGKDILTCSYLCTNGQSYTERPMEISLKDYPHLQRMLSDSKDSILDIYDVDDLPSDVYGEIARILGGHVKSLLMLPIENNDNAYGYLVLQSVTAKKSWGTVEKNNLMIIANVIADTIERIRQEKQINYMAYYDMLTGLPNRTLFKDRLKQAVMLAERKSEIIAVVMVDLDRFKNVNDMIGYEGGDEIIIQVARKLYSLMRKSDTVARFGSDEFLIMAHHIGNSNDVHRIANKIVGIFKKPFTLRNQEIYISASVGVAVYPYDGTDADTLIKNADIAMYEAKAKGKGQYCLCTEEMKEEVMIKHELSNKLYRAIDNKELVLHYQPMVSARTGEILCMEALVRWNQPEHGLISPGVFIPLAEQTGLINPIGEWVLRTACGQAKAWLDMGLPPIHISVNVSVLQLRNSRFVSIVENILKETGLKPEYLDLEITESVAVKESDNILDVLGELRKLGIEISIDDFGTEYSSLSRLNHMPVNRIKIDKSFISNMFRSEKEQTLVKGMIHLLQTLGLKVVAEGVEEKDQFEFLKQNGCDEVQGYYISRPVRANDVLKLFEYKVAPRDETR
ncbi:MAG TPA: EAL domain-containing protein [Thermoclostridium sp.]|nr:EAL domain-containing protein [Thermoclostridium sp.]